MFCKHCGKEVKDEAVICPNCGCQIKKMENNMFATDERGKSRLVALLLWFFFGGFGAHRFYMGRTGSAVAMIICLFLSWLIIPGIVLLIWLVVDLAQILINERFDDQVDMHW